MMEPTLADAYQQLHAVEDAYQKRAADDLLLFARGLTIPSATGARFLNEIAAPFQLDAFRAIAPSLQAVRDGVKPPCGRFWVERTKGASKDSDLAICLLWLLAFPKRPIYLQVGAADRDQAAIIRRRMEDLLHYNEWLRERVAISQYGAVNLPGRYCVLDILAADVAGSHGETPDVLVVNELSHVSKWEFIENLLDNADKVSQGVVLIATNAGFKGSRADKLRATAIGSPERWQTHIWAKPAPWISEENIRDAEKRNLRSRYRRLWWGVWASGKGDAINEDHIDRCLSRHKGPLERPEPGWLYIAGLDLGVTHDHSGLVVVGVETTLRRVRVAWMRGWEPDSKTGEVSLIEVKDTILRLHKLFHFECVSFDPTEARLMAQELRRKGVPMREMTFSSARALQSMANALMQVLNDNLLEAYDDEEGRLRRDFGKFNIVEKSYGYRLEAVSDEYGHADVGTALAICLPRALDLLAGRPVLLEGDVLVNDDNREVTDEEIEQMPEEFRDLFDAYDQEERQVRRERVIEW